MIRKKNALRIPVFVLILTLLLSVGAIAADEQESLLPDASSLTDGLPVDSLQDILGSIDLAPIREKLSSLSSTEIFEELKELLAKTKEMTDEELAEQIRSLAEEHDVTLNDTQVSQLAELCRHYESLSELELKEKYEKAVSGFEKLEEFRKTAGEWKEKASEAAEKVSEAAEKAEPVFGFLKEGLKKIGNYLLNLF